MNALFPRFLKLAYRKEPISSFVLIVGAVDAVMGGVSGRWFLMSVGGSTILVAILLRWWQAQKALPAQETARRALPPSSPLPALTSKNRR